jgi:4'-phosphopantetheinyl transferase EntD
MIAQAVESRRGEYATVRSCVRACLARLGYPRVPILPGAGGAPGWPAGIRGSMTHPIHHLHGHWIRQQGILATTVVVART